MPAEARQFRENNYARDTTTDRCVRGGAGGLDAVGADARERGRCARQRRQDRSGTRVSRDLREPLLRRRQSRSRQSGSRARRRGTRPARADAARAGRTRRGGGAGPGATPDRATWYASPYKVFDNFYWLGTRQHSSWALRTSDGLIIIDTNFAWATEPEIINGLTTLGLDPRQIKYVVISHAHGDHDQGAAELQKRFGAKVVMGAPDWDSTLQRPATAAGGVPTRDVSVGPAGMKLTLGDTTIDIVPTPGHTPGTLSYVFPVKDQGRTVMVAYSGGTLTGAFGTNAARWDEYVESQKRIAKAAADAGATVDPVEPQRVRQRLYESPPDRRQARSRRGASVRRRRRRRAAVFHRHDRMRDRVEAAGRSEVGEPFQTPK